MDHRDDQPDKLTDDELHRLARALEIDVERPRPSTTELRQVVEDLKTRKVAENRMLELVVALELASRCSSTFIDEVQHIAAHEEVVNAIYTTRLAAIDPRIIKMVLANERE